MDRGVRVQREAVDDREPALSGSGQVGQPEALLDGALLQHLVLVLRPRCVEVRPVLLRLPQQPVGKRGSAHPPRRSGLLAERVAAMVLSDEYKQKN